MTAPRHHGAPEPTLLIMPDRSPHASLWATAPVVPGPAKESSTRSARTVDSSMIRFKNRNAHLKLPEDTRWRSDGRSCRRARSRGRELLKVSSRPSGWTTAWCSNHCKIDVHEKHEESDRDRE